MSDSKPQRPPTYAEKDPSPPTMVDEAAVWIAPAKPPPQTPERSVFLAGSIEQDKADNWQPRMTQSLSDITCSVFNPRRPNWDPKLIQRASNPEFREQVDWELDLLERADIIAMYFDPESKSPITLLELGLHIEAKDEIDRPKLILACPEKFYRLGNVEIVCEKAGITVIDTYDKFVEAVRERLQDFYTVLPPPPPPGTDNLKTKVEDGKDKQDRKDNENTESEEGVRNEEAKSPESLTVRDEA